jgi:hypothetical protein
VRHYGGRSTDADRYCHSLLADSTSTNVDGDTTNCDVDHVDTKFDDGRARHR